jgi:hypothetical protein
VAAPTAAPAAETSKARIVRFRQELEEGDEREDLATLRGLQEAVGQELATLRERGEKGEDERSQDDAEEPDGGAGGKQT